MNSIRIDGDVAYLEFCKPDGNISVVFDLEDVQKVSEHKWSLSYRKESFIIVTRFPNGTRVVFPKFLLDSSDKKTRTTHINGNRFDFRKSNLKCGNKIRIDGEAAYVEMLFMRNRIEAIIDIKDIPIIEKYQWRAHRQKNKKEYFVVSGRKIGEKSKCSTMARILVAPATGLEVDHIDRNPLNNRRTNLRVLTTAANNQNKSGRGITFQKETGRWAAIVNLGTYENLDDAVAVAASFRSYHKKFSPDDPVTDDFEDVD